MVHKRTDHLSERINFNKKRVVRLYLLVSQHTTIASSSNESGLNLALRALQNDSTLSIRKASEIYNVPYSTLYTRRDGRTSRRDIPIKSKNLSTSEENTIVQRALELDAQGFPVRLSSVEDIANRLLRDRDAIRVGKN